LIEIIHGKTHTAVGDIYFDCPPMVFSPHPKVLAQYGGVTVVETKCDTTSVVNLLGYTPNDLKRLKSCIKNYNTLQVK
jgi:hypothetical protein